MHEFKSMQKCTLQQINRDVEAQEAPQRVRLIYHRARASSHECVPNAEGLSACFTVMFWRENKIIFERMVTTRLCGGGNW